GNNNIININTLDDVTITAHAARHLPNGADALTTAAPLTTLTTSTVNNIGTANSFARSDHTHAIDQTTFALNSLSGTLDVDKGGTGAGSFTAGNFLQGNGMSTVTALKLVPTGNVVGTTDAQVLTNKSLDDATTYIIDNADPTISITFDAGGATSTTTIIATNSTSNRTLTLPDITDIIITRISTINLTKQTQTH